MTFKLSKRSLKALEWVHPDLVKVVQRAIELTEVDFVVTEGLRTKERQAELFKAGASQTMNSRHLTGHAVDLAAWVDGRVDWSWPLYLKLAEAMKQSAEELGVVVRWGGTWTHLQDVKAPIAAADLHKRFPDGPHFELPLS